MVARSATDAAFSPAERPRIAVSADGTLAAIAEACRAVVLELPGGAPFAEIGIDPGAIASDIAWVGALPRLLVLSRYPAYSTAHLIDPHGPRTIAEIRLETAMKLVASVGAHGLAVGAHGAAVLTATDTHLTPYQFPSRTVPASAGGAAGNFVVALGGSIEEWDPASRIPKRRLRLPKPAMITAVGGSDRVVWLMTQNEPTRVDVIPLVNRGQPKTHELPEPIAQVAGHPRSDLIACLGAESGKIYVIDLDGRSRVRTLGTTGIERADVAALVIGRMVGVIAAQAGKPIAIVPLDGSEIGVDTQPTQVGAVPQGVRPQAEDGEPKKRSTLGIDDPDDDEAVSERPIARAPEPEVVTRPAWPPRPTAAETIGAPPAVESPEPEHVPRPAWPPRPAARSAEVRNAPEEEAVPRPAWPPRSAEPAPGVIRPAPEPEVTPRTAWAPRHAPPPPADAPPAKFSTWLDRRLPETVLDDAPVAELRPSWRDDLVIWTKAIIGGSTDRKTPSIPPLDAIAARLELAAHLRPAIALMYGAHLAGERGVAPMNIAHVLGRRWEEALGRGELATRGLARYHESRVMLSAPLQRAFDELPVATGTMVGVPGAVALLGPCCVVSADEALASLAKRYLAQVGGAILAAHADADPGELFVEARVRGAAPMLRIDAGDLVEVGTDAAVLVVATDEHAEQLGVPRL
ncbi:MAG: hypothetical protein H0T46_36200 [Deltaproteobacteria bacterium]|nr:hypothetical protein [Deltaproteobacteria bacterium]